MKIETCSFSGFKIYPGHGSLFVRGDSKVFRFVNYKSKSLFLQRKKQAKFDWTIVYRKLHKKGGNEEGSKKKRSKNVKVQRGVVGLSVEQMKLKRDMTPAARLVERKKAIEKVKQEKKEKKEKVKRQDVKVKVSKQQQKGFAPKAAATSR
jgi:large subunit ribosomal protein L24e